MEEAESECSSDMLRTYRAGREAGYYYRCYTQLGQWPFQIAAGTGGLPCQFLGEAGFPFSILIGPDFDP